MTRSITLIGGYSQTGAYPTLNRQLSKALQQQGIVVKHNDHLKADGELTDIALHVAYPPALPNVRHAVNATHTQWEFAGKEGVPQSFIDVFDKLDLIITASHWGKSQFIVTTQTPIKVVPHGFDPEEFYPGNEASDPFLSVFGEYPEDIVKVLWVGGSDARHGLDIAVKMIALLPDEYHLFCKISAHYPPPRLHHLTNRIHMSRSDLPSLAPLYRACDLYLHTARAVGFSLPVLEAIACGANIVSTPLPPVIEYGIDHVYFSNGGKWEYYPDHPVHQDCRPRWYQPSLESLVETFMLAIERGAKPSDEEWRVHYSWSSIARRLIKALWT